MRERDFYALIEQARRREEHARLPVTKEEWEAQRAARREILGIVLRGALGFLILFAGALWLENC